MLWYRLVQIITCVGIAVICNGDMHVSANEITQAVSEGMDEKTQIAMDDMFDEDTTDFGSEMDTSVPSSNCECPYSYPHTSIDPSYPNNRQWYGAVFSSLTVKDFDLWLSVYQNLKSHELTQYMDMQAVNHIWFLQEYDSSTRQRPANNDVNDSISKTKTKSSARVQKQPQRQHTQQLNNYMYSNSNSHINKNIFYELSFVTDNGSGYNDYLEHNKGEGNTVTILLCCTVYYYCIIIEGCPCSL